MNSLATALESLVSGRPLTAVETRAAVSNMLDGEAGEAAVAAFLTTLRLQGVTADELEGAVAAVRERMIRFDTGVARECIVDTCGTGGDGCNTINISTAAALVVAARGVPVVKHGNRAASGSSGSSDVLSALGVAVDPEPPLLRRALEELRITFLFAPRFHPGFRHVAPVRRQLPFGTLFNLVGPLCNPACPAFQLVGTPRGPHANVLAEVLSRLDHVRRAAVVSGEDGLDEVTLGGSTEVLLVESGRVLKLTWRPEDFGLRGQSADGIRIANAGASAERIRRTLAGEKGPVRDYVLANSAAALWITGQYSLRDAVDQAAWSIDSGAATGLLERWARLPVDETS